MTYLVSVEYLGNTSMRDPQVPGDDTGSDPCSCHLDDLETDVVGKWSSIDKDSSQLVHSSLALNERIVRKKELFSGLTLEGITCQEGSHTQRTCSCHVSIHFLS